MKYQFFILSCLLFLVSCQKNISNDHEKVDDEMLLYNLKVLSHDSLQGRFFGTEGNYKAQRFIAAQFDSLDIKPAYPSGYIQKFPHTFKGEFRQDVYPVSSPKSDFSNVPDTTVIGGNVVAMIKGENDKAIVITGHLDHLGVKNDEIFNGADDNASGSAALISIANYFKDKPLRHTLIFAAVDAEEIGSLGADYLLNNFPVSKQDIALNINMDMIAHNDSEELFASGSYHYPYLKQPLEDLKSSNIKLLFGHDNPTNKNSEDWTFSSDHREFHKRQIPYIYFGVEDHEDYHQSTDTYDNINEIFYVDAVELIIDAIEAYDAYLSNPSK